VVNASATAPIVDPVVVAGADESATRFKPAWLVLFALALCYFFNAADRQLLTIVQEPIAHELRLSDSALGSLGTFFAVAYGLASFPLAAWSDRGWARWVITLTFAGWSVMTIASGAATSLLTLGLSRSGVALGEAGCAPAAQAMIARRFPLRLGATAMGVLLTAGLLGGALSSGIGGVLARELGWRATFLACGAVGLVLSPFVWFALRREVAPPRSAQIAGGAWRRVASAYWSRKSLRLMCVAGIATGIGGGGVGQWIGSVLMREHGLNVSQAGVGLLAAMLIGGGAGAVVNGLSADRWGTRDPRAYAAVPSIALLVGTGAMVALAFAPDALVAIVAFGLIVSIANGVLAPMFTLVQRLAPSDGRAQSAVVIMLMTNLVGTAFGPLIFGVASDVSRRLGMTQTLTASILVGALSLFLGAIAAFRASSYVGDDVTAHDSANVVPFGRDAN
jgi:predicted MFS family arabinose efflux permease